MLGYLFIDMNAYFASVEQHLRPELRGQPVGVVPMLADTTCCIAASYEAKKYGVKTGTGVAEARRLCPRIRLVEARPDVYVRYHHRVVAAVESCLHVDVVMSIDEMMCRLIGEHRREATARDLAARIKAAIRRDAGEFLRCSIGIAPNRMLAKMAADLQKPDGLTVIRAEELPQRLFGLSLTDFPGVGERMQARLHRYGVTTVEQFSQMTVDQISRVWGSKLLGRMWWHRLRGDDLPDPPTQRRSVGHSHVLPPDIRTDAEGRSVLICMTHKAAARLRRIDYWAQSVSIDVSYWGGGGTWHDRRRIMPARDTHSLVAHVAEMWDRRPAGRPLKVGVVLGDLLAAQSATRPLFDENVELQNVSDAMDKINEKLGDHAIYLGSMHGAAPHDPLRIAFTRIPEARRMYELREAPKRAWGR
ncbi:MAG: type VI secretion protein ImpB [Pirellulales bacterium]|nr:type VI secretion protein ImpB [Pirellulales bacterium]